MDIDGSERTVRFPEPEADFPDASVIETENVAVPVPEDVHVGLDAVVEEKCPAAPDSDQL